MEIKKETNYRNPTTAKLKQFGLCGLLVISPNSKLKTPHNAYP